MDAFHWQGNDYDIVVAPDENDRFLALYWEYSCPRAHPYETADDALCMLKSDEANGEIEPAGIVNRFTGETAWEQAG